MNRQVRASVNRLACDVEHLKSRCPEGRRWEAGLLTGRDLRDSLTSNCAIPFWHDGEQPTLPEFIADGVNTTISRRSVHDLIDRLVDFVQAKGATVYARIDHAANAASVGLKLRPTELLIFGNPAVGTVLMQEQQEIGLDLPLKVLAWEDENGEVWLTYDDDEWLANRHRLGSRHSAALQGIETFMASVARAATDG
jgi:uncharacterized protein (DUF302 family)